MAHSSCQESKLKNLQIRLTSTTRMVLQISQVTTVISKCPILSMMGSISTKEVNLTIKATSWTSKCLVSHNLTHNRGHPTETTLWIKDHPNTTSKHRISSSTEACSTMEIQIWTNSTWDKEAVFSMDLVASRTKWWVKTMTCQSGSPITTTCSRSMDDSQTLACHPCWTSSKSRWVLPRHITLMSLRV